MNKKNAEQIEQIIGYKFSNRKLLAQAFTHSSSVENRLLSYERLEFLGDSILAFIICQILCERFPEYLEGDLTKVKSMLVSRQTCSKLAHKMSLHKYLIVGKGMSNSHSLPGSLSAGVFEALVAAIYLDGGIEESRKFISTNFAGLIARADARYSQGNFKSMLQQYVQQKYNTTPVYKLLAEKGPDHNKQFQIQVTVGDRSFPCAWGASKKDAEQRAALEAITDLGLYDNHSSGKASHIKAMKNT